MAETEGNARKESALMDKKEKLKVLQERLDAYYKAEQKILKSQSYSIGSNQVTRANLERVQAQIKELESEIATLESRGTTKRRSARVVPVD